MAIELHGENFQSWESFDLKMEDLTVVVGPSNVGKSAFARAIRGLVRNSLNPSQVRVGSDGIVLEATIDGHKVIARRPKKGSVSYTVDGEDYEKLDGAIPQPVIDLGLGELVIGGVKLDPIFSKQFGNQFMLEEGSTALNTIFGAFSSTEKLEFGKKQANTKIAERNSEAKVIAKNQQALEATKVTLEALAIRAAESQSAILSLEEAANQFESIVEALDSLIEHKVRHDHLKAILAQVAIPDTEPVAHGIQLVQALTSAAIAKQKHRTIEATLEVLHVPDTADALTLHRTSRYAAQAAASKVALGRAENASAAIAVCVAGWTDLVAIFQAGKALKGAKEALVAYQTSRPKAFIERLDQEIEKIEALITGVTPLSKGIKGIDGLIEHRKALEAHQCAVPALDEEIAAAQANLDAVTEAHQAHQQALAVAAAQQQAAKKSVQGCKTCPKCGETIAA